MHLIGIELAKAIEQERELERRNRAYFERPVRPMPKKLDRRFRRPTDRRRNRPAV